MGYKQPSRLLQSWWIIKYSIKSWFEWQNAKSWAKWFRPSWVILSTNSSEHIREEYRRKILKDYKRFCNGETTNIVYCYECKNKDWCGMNQYMRYTLGIENGYCGEGERDKDA